MRGALREELIERLPWLFDELGFRIREHDYSNKHMGSSFAVLESSNLLVKFVNDRGSIGVEVASPSEPVQWMELGFLWFALTGNRPRPELEGWAWFLREHLAQIAEALGPNIEKTRGEFSQREKESKEILARHLESRPWYTSPAHLRTLAVLGWVAFLLLLIWTAVR